MASALLQEPSTFSSTTKATFSQYLHDHPNKRRVCQAEKEAIIEWLINSQKHPSTQEEFSRRNYVRKTFAWEEETRRLFAIARKAGHNDRMVVVHDMIADVVEFVHRSNGHRGWDQTWKDISTSYHGILRSDVIFLLKRCQECAENPNRRPKRSTTTETCHELIHNIAESSNNSTQDNDLLPKSNALEGKKI